MTDIKVGDWIRVAFACNREIQPIAGPETAKYYNQHPELVAEVRSPAPEPCVWTRLFASIWNNSHQQQSYGPSPTDWAFCPHCGAPLQIAPPRPEGKRK